MKKVRNAEEKAKKAAALKHPPQGSLLGNHRQGTVHVETIVNSEIKLAAHASFTMKLVMIRYPALVADGCMKTVEWMSWYKTRERCVYARTI